MLTLTLTLSAWYNYCDSEKNLACKVNLSTWRRIFHDRKAKLLGLWFNVILTNLGSSQLLGQASG